MKRIRKRKHLTQPIYPISSPYAGGSRPLALRPSDAPSIGPASKCRSSTICHGSLSSTSKNGSSDGERCPIVVAAAPGGSAPGPPRYFLGNGPASLRSAPTTPKAPAPAAAPPLLLLPVTLGATPPYGLLDCSDEVLGCVVWNPRRGVNAPLDGVVTPLCGSCTLALASALYVDAAPSPANPGVEISLPAPPLPPK